MNLPTVLSIQYNDAALMQLSQCAEPKETHAWLDEDKISLGVIPRYEALKIAMDVDQLSTIGLGRSLQHVDDVHVHVCPRITKGKLHTIKIVGGKDVMDEIV